MYVRERLTFSCDYPLVLTILLVHVLASVMCNSPLPDHGS